MTSQIRCYRPSSDPLLIIYSAFRYVLLSRIGSGKTSSRIVQIALSQVTFLFSKSKTIIFSSLLTSIDICYHHFVFCSSFRSPKTRGNIQMMIPASRPALFPFRKMFDKINSRDREQKIR